MAKKVLLKADLHTSVAAALEKLAKDQEVSVNEALRRAISNEVFMRSYRVKGYRVLIEKKDQTQQIVFLGDLP